jgi:RNA polymerase sigma factor (sigma-70 family)
MNADASPTPRQIAEAVLQDENQRRKLFAYAGARFGIGPEDSEDLLQDTVLELLRCRSFVRSPEAFVFAVFRARCARFIGDRMVSRGVGGVEAGDCDLAAAPAPQGVDSEFALREALNEVSSACRRLLKAYYVEGQSLREAARTLSLAYSSVAKTISRCLKRLRKCLE